MGFNPNPNQEEVINYGKGTLLVEAGPGSGKTTVIVEKINELINRGVKPETFLVITFTRKAADNLKRKLKKFLTNDQLNKMQISTIHSFCLDFLKEKDITLELLDEDTSERKSLFIQKFKEKLGFKGKSILLDYQIPGVSNKFEEYTYFKVEPEGLLKYLNETRPVSQEYLDMVESMDYFSYKKLQDEDLTEDYYNARFQQVVESYQKYLDILDENNVVDYNTVQLKTLELLKKDPVTRYTTIFVDEFQDTDPLQFRIFKILLENSEYFTAVGDVDQHIYGFRSSFVDYFEEMQDNYDVKRISLDVNYRSTENIVGLTDSFIEHQRSADSIKDLKSDNKKYNNPNFLLRNDDYKSEAQNIYDIIAYLKETGKINDYGEVAVLYRNHSNKTVGELINKFSENDIDFTIRGQNDLSKQNEVQSIITLLWYITRKTHYGRIPSTEELNERNLKALCGDYFEPVFWSLTETTKDYLRELQDSYYDDIVTARKEVRKSQGRSANVSAYKSIKSSEDLDTLNEVFKKVQTPVIDISKIEDENDRNFFEKLESLRQDIEEESKTLLDVYYELLMYGDYFKDFKKNVNGIKNLAMLSQSVYNYQTMISETDVGGLYFFLNGIIDSYSSSDDDAEGVQLMTIHSAKGLEFPVTIVTSLENNKFPGKSKDPERKKRSVNRKDTFYTPYDYLEYKLPLLEKYRRELDDENLTWIDIDNMLNEEEEERVVYVAMTRAADLLILSSIGEIPHQIEKITDYIAEYNSPADLDEVAINKHFTNQEKESLKLNFSKYNLYKSCPFNYHLAYDIGFMVPRKDTTDLGTVFHNVMDSVNQTLKHDKNIDDETLNKTISDVYSSLFDINENPEQFEKIKTDIINYTKNNAVEYDVIDSELPFSVERDEYTLNGAIDLIYKINDNEIGILDYKNAEVNDYKIWSYSHQLYTYASALRELGDFKDFDITEAKIHFVKSGVENIKINEELIKQQENKLNEVALKINDEKYPKITQLRPDRENKFCEFCEFKWICDRCD